jgi:hypothetical protein
VSWKVTVRHGPQVEREKLDSLEQALESARAQVASVLGESRLGEINAIRTYEPGQRVHARVEISGPGMLHGREAGIDVMGDGTLVPYLGSIRKRALGEAPTLDQALERIRAELA